MSTIHGKWNVEDVRNVIQSLDAKTGMDGASIHIWLNSPIGKRQPAGTYHQSKDHCWRSFSFSLEKFNDKDFSDLAVIGVIRQVYCLFLVDALDLKAVFDDEDDYGVAWRTVCGLLNTNQYGICRVGIFRRVTEDSLRRAAMASDIPSIDIQEQMDRWGYKLPSISRRRNLEKELIKKYTKNRVFSNNERVIHSKFGEGTVMDTMPCENKQLLYVRFDVGEARVVQNRQVYKVINGSIKKPVSKAR